MKITVREGFSDLEVYIHCAHKEEAAPIETWLRAYEHKLAGVKDGHTYLIDARDALYIESVDKRCFIYTSHHTYETPLKLYEWEERLADTGFIRISKAQIANMAKIASLCPDFGGRIEAVMENGESLIVSRQYAKTFKERLGLK